MELRIAYILRVYAIFQSCIFSVFQHSSYQYVSPFLSLEQQSTKNLLWERDRFYDNIEHYHDNFGNRTFIHGHTPDGVLFRLPYRINLDSGCVFHGMMLDGTGGKLSCMELNEDNPINSTIYQLEYGKTEIEILDNSSVSWPS